MKKLSTTLYYYHKLCNCVVCAVDYGCSNRSDDNDDHDGVDDDDNDDDDNNDYDDGLDTWAGAIARIVEATE